MKISKKMAENILKKIEEYETIIVFRHDSPDFDALGSQFGVYYWLKENFKNKKVYAPGTSFTEVGRNLYPKNDVLDDKVFDEPFLALVLDTSATRRISDKRYSKADYIIKIDHHPNEERYGNINLVRDEAGAASEVIYCLLTTKTFRKYKIPDATARYLYSGIVGDTGRFQYSSTSAYTMKCAAELYKYDFDPVKDVYYPLYNKPISDFEAIKTVMNNYHLSEHGVAYYILRSEDCKKLNIDSDDGKAYLYLFNYCDDIKVWCAFCEDDRIGNFRASLRSRDVVVNEIASHFGGGGHKFAAGSRPKNMDEVIQLVNELDNEIVRLGL